MKCPKQSTDLSWWTRPQGTDSMYVPASKIFIEQGCTMYPNLDKCRPENVAAARNNIEMCDREGPPFIRKNTRSGRHDYLDVKYIYNERFKRKRGLSSTGDSEHEIKHESNSGL